MMSLKIAALARNTLVSGSQCASSFTILASASSLTGTAAAACTAAAGQARSLHSGHVLCKDVVEGFQEAVHVATDTAKRGLNEAKHKVGDVVADVAGDKVAAQHAEEEGMAAMGRFGKELGMTADSARDTFGSAWRDDTGGNSRSVEYEGMPSKQAQQTRRSSSGGADGNGGSDDAPQTGSAPVDVGRPGRMIQDADPSDLPPGSPKDDDKTNYDPYS